VVLVAIDALVGHARRVREDASELEVRRCIARGVREMKLRIALLERPLDERGEKCAAITGENELELGNVLTAERGERAAERLIGVCTRKHACESVAVVCEHDERRAFEHGGVRQHPLGSREARRALGIADAAPRRYSAV
jgi:hypothetical protein